MVLNYVFSPPRGRRTILYLTVSFNFWTEIASFIPKRSIKSLFWPREIAEFGQKLALEPTRLLGARKRRYRAGVNKNLFAC